MKKIKKLLAVLICMAMVMAVMPGITVLAVRDSGECGANLTWSIDTLEGVLRISGTGAMEQYPWSEYRRKYRDDITDVVIEEGVTSISYEAFYNCENLTSVSLPSTLKQIEDKAFYYCINLKNINFPANLVSIGWESFYESGLEKAIMGDKITSIGKEAFCDCENLTEVHLSEKLTEIPTSLFDGCEKLQTVNIPAHLKKIGDDAFWGCLSLTNLALPEGLEEIDYAAFAQTGLQSITLPSTLKSLGERDGDYYRYPYNSDGYVFSSGFTYTNGNLQDGCDNLTDITININLNDLEYRASWYDPKEQIFEGCDNITYVRFGEKVKGIPASLFKDKQSLEIVLFSDAVEDIGVDAFSGCPFISDVIYVGTEADWNSIYIDKGNETLQAADRHYVNTYDEAYKLYDKLISGIDPDAPLFSDLNMVPWANEAINTLAEAGIVNGIGNGIFAPMDNVTRAQFVHMIVNAFGFGGNGVITFSDVGNQWFANSVLIAANNGLVGGYDGKFNPDDNITCQDAAVILKRVLDMKGVNLSAFVTVPETIGADYALDAIGVLRANGIITPEIGFSPFLYASRAQAAYMIYGAYKLYMGI